MSSSLQGTAVGTAIDPEALRKKAFADLMAALGQVGTQAGAQTQQAADEERAAHEAYQQAAAVPPGFPSYGASVILPFSASHLASAASGNPEPARATREAVQQLQQQSCQ